MAPDGCEGVTTSSRQFCQCASVVVVVAVVCLSGCSLSRATSLGADRDEGRPSNRAAAARLNIASFYFDSEIDTIYGREMNRIQALCDTDNFQCLATNFKPIARRVADVHSAPDSSSSVIAHVDAVFEPHDGYIINIRLEIQEAAQTGGSVTWLASVGDWHYGIEVPGVRISGDWIQPVGHAFPADGWLFSKHQSFEALVEPLVDDILALPELWATRANGATERIPPGSYFIEGVTNGVVRFRAEVSTDMACGEDVEPPAVMPPSFRADAREFFDLGGKALFSAIYQKGC